MARSNRDRIGQMFDALATALDEFITGVLGPHLPAENNWTQLVSIRDVQKGIENKKYSRTDPALALRMLTENIPHQVKPGWYPFDGQLNPVQKSYASELRDARNGWAHGDSFSDDDAYRILDTAERLAKSIGAPAPADTIKGIRLNLRRVTADKDDKKTLKVSVDNPEAAGLKPWREVLQPHEDVATGNFHASEFAADLYKVANGDESDSDYADPVEFFKRTYLTEGLSDLITRAVRRLSGDDNASPVINLQTNFGGGKTHSMLSLWHVAAGLPVGEFPQATQELLGSAGYAGQKVNRVAIVGNHLSPSGVEHDGTHVNTIWGELAWQLGGKDGYAMVAKSDQDRTPPGKGLHDLLSAYAPAVILVDEWVAYARSLVGRDDLAGGSFDDQFTFAQSLTEAAKGTAGVLLAISIPASETGDAGDKIVAGNAEEVGGANGLEALKRLQNVVRRVASQWRPANSDEAYHIVKQRLFVTPDATALASIGATAKAYVEMYRKHGPDFPRETRDSAYEDRIKQTYPIHPELFDRLYEDWSSLERFQRTRGVLRLMSTVIHELWRGDDASPLIMPGSIPLATSNVNSELTQYLQDSWKAIIDADVDGPNSEPVKIDLARSSGFGARKLTKRLARTVFFGAAPTIGSSHKGIDATRVFLGTAVPGDIPGNFHAALAALGDRATYFYSGSGKYWYDLQANITRRAKDQAERLHQEEVWVEITNRLSGQAKTRGSFAGVHVCPEDNADINDNDEARLVILHPKVWHKKGTESAAVEFAQKATEQKGGSSRTNRNMVVYMAADEDRLAELETAVRDFLGWSHVLANADELDLTQNQKNQATEKRSQADSTADSRLLGAYQWLLTPVAHPGAPFTISVLKLDGSATSLAERASKKMGNDGSLNVQQSAHNIALWLQGTLKKMWASGHVPVGDLWRVYAQYPYMPRLRDQDVFKDGLLAQPPLWQRDGFAFATSYDESTKRYVGLVLPSDGQDPQVTDSLLLVKPDVALAQRETETAEVTAPVPDLDDPKKTFTPDPDHPGVFVAKTKKRFYGTKTLNSQRYAVDFKNIHDEILTHLAQSGVDLKVEIHIEAIDPTGFDEAKVRTVSENADTLKFEQSGFEDA